MYKDKVAIAGNAGGWGLSRKLYPLFIYSNLNINKYIFMYTYV